MTKKKSSEIFGVKMKIVFLKKVITKFGPLKFLTLSVTLGSGISSAPSGHKPD